jgi:DNA-binding LacI/PurR family transcriptional regulator
VVGFDDIAISSNIGPALTTPRRPIGKIISHAIRLAVAMARDPSTLREPLPPDISTDSTQ